MALAVIVERGRSGGTVAAPVISANVAGSATIGSLIAGSAALHRPHFPTSAR